MSCKGRIMKTTVVCGLLGSGKTTFIRNFLKHGSEKTVVLVNDFGAAGIDGEIFSAGGIESVELPSGCVCCTLKFDLITTIERIVRQFAPDHLVIEPSGVASPSGVLEALESAGIKAVTVVGIIDAVEFLELYESGMYGSFFEDQVSLADVILVNKTDLADVEMIIKVISRIESINPRAIMFRTVNAEIRQSLPGPSPLRRDIQTRQAHFHFDTFSVKLRKGVQFDLLRALVDDLARGTYGTVVRAKVLAGTERGPFRFDITYGKVDCAPFEKDIDDSRMVIIGESLNRDRIVGGVASLPS